MRGAQKKSRPLARLARFYGINPFELTPIQRTLLTANLEASWADEVLRERGGGMGNRDVYRLTLLATGDRDAAERARVKRIEAELRAGLTPEV